MCRERRPSLYSQVSANRRGIPAEPDLLSLEGVPPVFDRDRVRDGLWGPVAIDVLWGHSRRPCRLRQGKGQASCQRGSHHVE